MTRHDIFSFIKIGFRAIGIISLFVFLGNVLHLSRGQFTVLSLIAFITVGAEVFGVLEEL